jgi:hypothetical protein
MMAAGRYLYCISESSGYSGLESLGLFEKPVRFIGYKELGAFVSDVQPGKIRPDLQTITAHQNVVEASRKMGPTMPVKFGVIFNTEDGVRELLSKDYEKYRSKLASFRDKDEFGIKVLVSNPAHSYSKPVVRKIERPRSAGKGTDYLMKLREEDAQRSERLKAREKLRETIRSELSEYAEAETPLNSDVPQIVLNSAYLVRRTKQESFKASAEKIGKRIESGGFLMYCSGPWAPYSFC